MKEEKIEEYEAKLDNKRRCVIRGVPPYDRYHIEVYKSGRVVMTPRVLASPEQLSSKTLKMISKSAENMKKGKVGQKVDFDKYRDSLEKE